MHETTADVRRDIEETRARVSQTLGQLQEEVGERRSAVTERVVAVKDRVETTAESVQDSVVDFAREHPWYALAAAVGVGLLIGRSGADEAAARGAVSGTRNAATSVAGATASAARAGAEKAKGLVRRGGDDPRPDGQAVSAAGMHATAHQPATGAIGSSAEDTGELDAAPESGIMYRLRTGIVEVLGVNELLAQMRAEADRFGRVGSSRHELGGPLGPGVGVPGPGGRG